MEAHNFVILNGHNIHSYSSHDKHYTNINTVRIRYYQHLHLKSTGLKSVQERHRGQPLHTCQEETHAFLRAIPYKPQLTMAPDRFRNAFRIRFRFALPFGTDHTYTCGFSLRDENDSHPLRCNAHGSNYAYHNATLAFVKSLARDAGYHAPKGDFCVRESTSADGVRR
jgi:hypothetical protein